MNSIAKVKLNKEKLDEIDREYWHMQVHEGVDPYTVEESKND